MKCAKINRKIRRISRHIIVRFRFDLIYFNARSNLISFHSLLLRLRVIGTYKRKQVFLHIKRPRQNYKQWAKQRDDRWWLYDPISENITVALLKQVLMQILSAKSPCEAVLLARKYETVRRRPRIHFNIRKILLYKRSEFGEKVFLENNRFYRNKK